MSTLQTTNLKNPSSGSNNIVLGADGATTLGTTKVTTLADSAGANTSTPAAIAAGIAKAWVNFNGTGTVAIRASYNVSSITDNGTGDYTVNFTTALADANYSMTASCSYRSGNYNSAHIFTNASGTIVAPTTTAARLQLSTVTLGSADSEYVTVAIFR